MLACRIGGVPPVLPALPASRLNDHCLPLFVITVWDILYLSIPACQSPIARAETTRPEG
jgi:hypothetical protein